MTAHSRQIISNRHSLYIYKENLLQELRSNTGQNQPLLEGDIAKVQQNFETAKDLVKKALPPSSRRTRFVPDALLVKELNRASQQQQLRRMESRFTAHYCRGAQTYRSTRNFLFRTLQ